MPSSEYARECREALEAHVEKVKLSPEIEAVVQKYRYHILSVDDVEPVLRTAVTESLALAGRDTERLDWLEKNANFIEVGHGDIAPCRSDIDDAIAARTGGRTP